MAAPPYLSKLLNLLEKKPNTLGIAEKMVKRLINKKAVVNLVIKGGVEELNQKCSHLVIAELRKPFVCQEFHWNCIMEYLTSETAVVRGDEVVQSIKFFSLTKHVQERFLTLLVKVNKTIPKQCLEYFLSKTKSLYLKEDNDWTSYLLRKLTVLCSEDKDEHHCMPFTIETVKRLTDVCGTSGDSSFVKLFIEGTSTAEASEKKRTREEVYEDDETDIDVKRFKTDESSDDVIFEHKDSPVVKVPHLGEDIKSVISVIKSAWSKGEKASSQDFIVITNLTFKEFQVCLSQLTLEATSESNLLAIIHTVIDPEVDVSFQILTAIISDLIAPHFTNIQKLVSRVLLASLTSMVTKYPLSSIDGLIYPFLLIPGFNAYQSDLACKLIKQVLNDEQRKYLWRKFVSTPFNEDGEPFIWNEHLIGVIQQIVQKGVTFDDSSINSLILSLQTNSSYNVTSLKFAQFVCTLLTRHTAELVEHVNILGDIAKNNNTILKNRLISLTEKLSSKKKNKI